mgnify:CR=1 FL=1
MSGVDPEFTQPSFEGERNNYDVGGLDEAAAAADPFVQLRRWLDEAAEAQVREPTAMTVSSLGIDERVHSRTVLLRQLTSSGLVFFTNRDSHKGEQLAAHALCAAQLLWLDLHRQVRVEGVARLLDDRVADDYFARGGHAEAFTAVATVASALGCDCRVTIPEAARGRAQVTLYADIQRQIANDAVNAFIFNPSQVSVSRKGLKGLWANSPVAANDLSQVSWQ